MRYILELIISIAVAAGVFGALMVDVFCWNQAYEKAGLNAPISAQFAIAGAIITGLLAIAVAIYLRPRDKSGPGE